MTSDPPKDYASAVSELEALLRAIEDAEVDVDVLASAVERAAVLLAFCRATITRAEARVKEVLAEVDKEAEGGEAEPPRVRE